MVKALPAIEDHLYEQMASKIHQLIQRGTLRPGERVPSVRKLSVRPTPLRHRINTVPLTLCARAL